MAVQILRELAPAQVIAVDTSPEKLRLAEEVGAEETIELIEVLDLARAGKIRAHLERFPLERAEDAYRRLRDGSLKGRAVICPHG